MKAYLKISTFGYKHICSMKSIHPFFPTERNDLFIDARLVNLYYNFSELTS